MSSAQPESISQPNMAISHTKLAKAIDAVVKSNLLDKVKLHKPNPFDGSSSKKLHTFLLQCKLKFQDQKDLFQDDSVKVNYILSYLKGPALNCFEPRLLEPYKPPWLSDYDFFVPNS